MKLNLFFLRGKDLLVRVLTPIVHNLPLFLTTFLLWSDETLRNLHGRLVTYDPALSFYDLFCRFSILFLIAYLFSVIATITNRTWVKSIIYLFVFSVFVFYLFLKNVFNLSISPAIFVLLAETNQTESKEFINTFVFSATSIRVVITISVVIMITIFAELFWRKGLLLPIKQKLKKNRLFLIISLMFVAWGIISSKTYIDLFQCKSTENVGYWNGANSTPKDPLSLLAYSVYGVHVLNEEQKSFFNRMRRIDTNVLCTTSDSLNIVLVIGESYIKSHSQLYGYSLNTTPHLIQERNSKNLFVFDDVVSPYAGTTATMRSVLCTNSVSDKEQWESSVFFPTLFRIAGYDVYFWDNQKGMTPDAGFTFSLNAFLYNKLLSAMTYTAINEKSYTYDDSIASSFDSVKLTNKHNLVMFHLMGQHVDPTERFPHTKDFMHFTLDSINRNDDYMTDEKRQCIADYDNATYYNDYVLSQIINHFRNTNTALVYFSDHGEEVYDYRDSRGRVSDNMSKNQVKYQFEIPFMIWLSDTFKETYPEKVYMIEEALDRPFMTDNLCHILFNIGGVKSQFYSEEKDLLSPHFKPRKRILNGNYDYNQIMNAN